MSLSSGRWPEALGKRTPSNQEEWIEEDPGDFGSATQSAARRFIEIGAEADGHAEVSSAQGSLIAVFETPSGPLSPMNFRRHQKGSVQLYLSYLAHRSAFESEGARKSIYDALASIVGPLSTASLKGFPKFAAGKLNDVESARRFVSLLTEIKRLSGKRSEFPSDPGETRDPG